MQDGPDGRTCDPKETDSLSTSLVRTPRRKATRPRSLVSSPLSDRTVHIDLISLLHIPTPSDSRDDTLRPVHSITASVGPTKVVHPRLTTNAGVKEMKAFQVLGLEVSHLLRLAIFAVAVLSGMSPVTPNTSSAEADESVCMDLGNC